MILNDIEIYLLEKPLQRSKMRHFWRMPRGKGCFKKFILPCLISTSQTHTLPLFFKGGTVAKSLLTAAAASI